MRDDFSDKVKRTVSARVANRCSNPECQALTSGPQSDTTKALNVGVAAHITAASPNGPRYSSDLTSKARCHPDNAIWLCQSCAKLVDNDPIRFSESLLREWKRRAEENAFSKVGKTNMVEAQLSAETPEEVIWTTLKTLQAANAEVTAGMLIEVVEGIEFKYIGAVTIISVLQHMRRQGKLTWNSKDITGLMPNSILKLNPEWLNK
jgi:hypothetical protein